MKKRYLFVVALLTLMTLAACGGGDDGTPIQPEPVSPQEQKDTTQNSQQPVDTTTVTPTPTPTPEPEPEIAPFFVGGDMSLLTKYEEQGAQWKDRNGKAISNLLTFVKEQGWNGVRVRLMVDPSKSADQKLVVQDLDYVKALGRRVKDAGLQLLLDFHYSDTWADPGKQWTPAAWASLNDAQLQQQLYDYTRDCLQQLAVAGATPDLIQMGNEISYGMLWGTEKAVGGNQTNRCFTGSPQQNWDRFFALLRQATKACREVCPFAKIIIHSERTPKPAVLIDFFDRMKTAQIDYDVIGLSYYPYFHGPLNTLEEALKQIWSKHYGKHVLIVETGYPWKWEVQGTEYDYTGTYPYTNAGQKAFTSALITMLLRHSEVCGLAWWYAEANAKGTTGDLAQGWYNAGLFDQETGRALDALYELKNFK